jgi:hypothetical protein
MDKPYRLALWGLKDRRTGIMLTGHDFPKPLTYLTHREADEAAGSVSKVIPLILEERNHGERK